MNLQALLSGLENDTMYLIETKEYSLADNNNFMFITSTGDQLGLGATRLPIKFNPKISSFKTIIQEQKIETIGGKYPVFFRNGNVRYKEIGIQGLISYHMASSGEFMAETELFPNNEFTRNTNLTYDNIVAEQKFREKVYNWLINGEPKLFVSPTEGIYLVRLMNVSLSPNETLGRMLYSFSCTGYECGYIEEVN